MDFSRFWICYRKLTTSSIGIRIIVWGLNSRWQAFSWSYNRTIWWTTGCASRLCMRVRLCNGYTRAYAQIMQHTHTHKAVTGRVEAKTLLSRRRQSSYRYKGVIEVFFFFVFVFVFEKTKTKQKNSTSEIKNITTQTLD